MDIDKIINNSIEKEKSKIRLDQSLFDNNWRIIQQKINAQSRKKEEKRGRYFKELSAVAAFVVILILVPTVTKYYKDKNIKLPNDNPAVTDTDTNTTHILNPENYDKTSGVINVNGDIKEQKRAENLVSTIAKKQYGDFMISYKGLVNFDSEEYHKINVYEVTKGKMPEIAMYFVKLNTDEIYYNDPDFRRVSGGNYCKNIKLDNRADGACLSKIFKSLKGEDLQFTETFYNQIQNDSNLLKFKDALSAIDSKLYHIYTATDDKVYAIKIDNKDIYVYDNSQKKLELLYKNVLNNDSTTLQVSDDINGDGKKEIIKYDYYNDTLTVNDLTISADTENPEFDLFTVDINKEDSMKEIVIKQDGPSGDYKINLFYFDGKAFATKHGFSGSDIVVDGSGQFTVKESRAITLQTWYHDMVYKLTSHFGVTEIPKEIYQLNQELKVKQKLQLQKSKTEKQIVATLMPGEAVTLIGCDDRGWCCIKNSNGVVGWFEVENFWTIKSVNLTAEKVFDGLYLAD